MSREAIKYLRKNKDKYPQEQLSRALKKNGYSDEDIKNSVERVYDPITEYSFWDFRSKTHYTSRRQRILDFLLGLVVVPVVSVVSGFIPIFGAILFSILFIVALVLS